MLFLGLWLVSGLITPFVRAAPPPPTPIPSAEWCLSRLLEKGPLCDATCDFEPLFDLKGSTAFHALASQLVLEKGADDAARMLVLRGFPIDRVTAAPGHAYLRNPAQLERLKAYIQSSNGGDFRHDPLLFNLITNEKNQVVTIDLWNAHHRLIAYLESGYHSLDEIPAVNFKILLNGRTSEGATWPHYLSLAGIDETKNVPYSIVPVGGEIRGGTVAVEGSHPNVFLGSRNTIGQLRKNMLYRKQPKIGVYFGTFDPPHRGHLLVVEKAIKVLNLDEAIIVPNPTPVHKPGATDLATRIELLRKFVAGHPRINLYLGDSGAIIDRVGRDPFFERMAQTYGTHDLYQVIGEDSFLKLVAEGAIQPKGNRKYVVFSRPTDTQPTTNSVELIPEGLRDVATGLHGPETFGLSSTAVRLAISRGHLPDETVLDPKVLELIRAKSLYRDAK